MAQSNPKWMEYLKTLIPVIILFSGFLIWYAAQATRISTLETKTAHLISHIKKCEKLQKDTNGHSYRLSSVEATLKTLTAQIGSINPIVPQVKRNTQNIQFILSKLDRHQDILIEVRTLVKTILDKNARKGVLEPNKGTKALRR